MRATRTGNGQVSGLPRSPAIRGKRVSSMRMPRRGTPSGSCWAREFLMISKRRNGAASELRRDAEHEDVLTEGKRGLRAGGVPMAVRVGRTEIELSPHQELGADANIVLVIVAVDAFEIVVDEVGVRVEQQIAQELVVEAQAHHRVEISRRSESGAEDLLARILHGAQRVELERVEASEIPDHLGPAVDPADRAIEAVLIILLEIAQIGLADDHAEIDARADIGVIARGVAPRIGDTRTVIEVAEISVAAREDAPVRIQGIAALQSDRVGRVVAVALVDLPSADRGHRLIF